MGPVEKFMEYHIHSYIFQIALPILVVVGTVGNIISIIVLLKPKHRRLSVTRVLTVLSFTDLFLLWICGLNNLPLFIFGYDIRSSSNYACKIMVFSAFSLGQLSALCIAVLTFNRFVSVWLPLKVKYICSLKNTSIQLISALMVSFLVNSHALIGLSVNKQGKCVQIKEIYDSIPVKLWINLQIALGLQLPVIFVFVINICIILILYMKVEDSRLISANTGQRKIKLSKTTKVLCLVSIVYLVSITPIGVFNSLYDGKQLEDGPGHNDAVILLFYAVAFVAFCFNSGVNFLLYFLCGSKFRKDVKSLLFLCKDEK